MKTYRYDELTEQAKEAAVEHVFKKEGEMEWDECHYESFQEVFKYHAETFGFSVEHVYWSTYPVSIENLDGFKVEDFNLALGKKLNHLYDYLREINEIEPEVDCWNPKKSNFVLSYVSEKDPAILTPIFERYKGKYNLPCFNQNQLRYLMLNEEDLYDTYNAEFESDADRLVEQMCETLLDPALVRSFTAFIDKCKETLEKELDYSASSVWVEENLENESYLYDEYVFTEEGLITEEENEEEVALNGNYYIF